MLKVTVLQFTVGLFCTISFFFYICNWIAGWMKRLVNQNQIQKRTRCANEKTHETKTP